MLKNKTSVVDDRGYNQGFKETYALQKRMERRGDWMIGEMNVDATKSILEIGCGTGYLAFYLARQTGMKTIGSDLCVPFIEQAKQKYVLPSLEYKVLDFNNPDLDSHSRFDYIIGNGILHHLYFNLDKALSSIKRLINEGGKIIFMEPNVYNPYVAAIFKNKMLRRWAKLEPDEMAFSKKYIVKKLKASGFRDTSVLYKDFLLPGVPRILVKPSIVVGNVLEKTPVKFVSQSLLISAAV